MKYYFFETFRINNAGCTKLRVLPGQTTYKDCTHHNEPVRTDWLVQANSDARGVMVRYPEGTRFAAAFPDERPIQTKLPVYSRDGQEFYRLENMLYPVTADPVSASHTPDEAMTAAWRAFSQNEETSVQESRPGSVIPETDVPDTTVAVSSRFLTQDQINRIVKAEPDFIEQMVRFVGGNARKTLSLARLRDRMLVGVAKFVYEKQNGDIRTAYGTRCPELIQRNQASESSGNPQDVRQNDGEHFHYFDMQKHSWRCFCVADFKELHDYFAVTEQQLATIPAL